MKECVKSCGFWLFAYLHVLWTSESLSSKYDICWIDFTKKKIKMILKITCKFITRRRVTFILPNKITRTDNYGILGGGLLLVVVFVFCLFVCLFVFWGGVGGGCLFVWFLGGWVFFVLFAFFFGGGGLFCSNYLSQYAIGLWCKEHGKWSAGMVRCGSTVFITQITFECKQKGSLATLNA